MSEPLIQSSAVANAFNTSGDVVEHDAAQRSQAMVGHILGIFGILGTGIYHLVKKNDPKAGAFVKDQVREAFNFHLAMFVALVGLNILTAVVVGVTGSAILGLLISLVTLVIWLAILALLVMSAIKANKGIAARYPVKIPALK
jgi:hypothetical protein